MNDHQQTPVHTFPDRGAGEWVAYEDYAAAIARAEKAEAEVDRLRILLARTLVFHDGSAEDGYDALGGRGEVIAMVQALDGNT